ncbi:hypothetical protein P0Y35_00360 [Kiritimatiellaeota bacterium B1221]|nr:hypothetical protein [Kiritimatiellaeota bacterium B1221]
MQNWVQVDLGDAMLANEALAALKEKLTVLYQKEGCPDGMIAVYRHESGELHCRLLVYLTSAFQAVAALENAQACGLPAVADFGFLAGNEMGARKLLS